MKSKLIKTKDLLDSVSPTMCVAKWKQLTLHLHNGRTHSCHHPHTHSIPVDELEARPDVLHNTKQKIQARKQMLDGSRPPECQYCWSVEDLKGFKEGKIFSDRIVKSADEWADEYLDEVSRIKSLDFVNPSYLEVSFSNQCNLKCSYCSPVYSSRWMEEVKSNGPYPTSAKFGDLKDIARNGELPIHHDVENPYVDAFWRWWPELIKTLKVLRITGGEPLLTKNTHDILEFLKENNYQDLEVVINSNASIPHKKFDDFVQTARALLDENRIKKFSLYTSVDGWREQAEYGRFGLNFDLWQKNIEHFLEEIPSANVVVMSTTNILSIGAYERLLKYILELKKKYINNRRYIPVSIDISILRHPHHQNISILTDDYKDSFDESLKYMRDNSNTNGFYDFEILKMERLVEFLKHKPNKSEKIDSDDARIDFVRFVDEHDKRRGTEFLKTYPNLKNFYEVCDRLSEESICMQQ